MRRIVGSELDDNLYGRTFSYAFSVMSHAEIKFTSLTSFHMDQQRKYSATSWQTHQQSPKGSTSVQTYQYSSDSLVSFLTDAVDLTV